MFNFRNMLCRSIAGTVLVLGILPLFTGAASNAQDNAKEVKIGVLAKRGSERCTEKWGPTAKYLSGEIPGCSFIIVPLDFNEIYPAVEQAEVDFILANPSFYVELELFYGANRLATLENLRLGGVYTVFGGVIFYRADRKDIIEINDLKGKTFMAVEKTSFAGWLAVWRELKERGIDPYSDFSGLSFGGSHDSVVYAVRDGIVDAGSVRTDAIERMAMEGKINLEGFKIFSHEDCSKNCQRFPFIHSTRLYPEWPFAKVWYTSDEFAEKVAAALLNMPPDCPAAKAAKCAGWTIPSNYQPVHNCLKELRIGPYKDYGKITLSDVIRNYWHWIVTIVILLILLCGVVIRVKYLNRNLQKSKSELRGELTERKKADKALQENENRFRELFDNMSSGVAVYEAKEDGKDFLFKDLNKSGERIEKIKKEDLIGKSILEVFPGVRDFGLLDVFQRVWKTGKPEHHPISIYKDDRISGWRENYIYRLLSGDIVAIYDDITERKRAEETLRESKERYKELIQNQGEGIGIVDTKEWFTFVNPAAESIFGVQPGKLVGCNIKDFVSPEQLKLVQKETQKRAKGEKSVYELEIVRPDKEIRNVLVTATPHFDSEKNLTGVFGVFRDITERKKAEEALKVSGEKYKILYETAGDAIMTLEPPEWMFTSGNYKIAEMFGVKDEEEFISLTPWQISPEYQPDGQLSEVKVKKMIEIAMKKGENFFEWTHKRVGGEEFFATVLLNRVEFGSKAFLQARVNDITESKRVEETLRDSEEKFRMISDSAQDAIIMIDNQGNISYWNKAAEKIFGYTEKEAMGKYLHEFIVPKSYYESSARGFKIFRKSGQGDAIGKTIELAAVGKNGAEFPVEVSLSSLKIKGEWNAMGILRDITERKKMQNELLKFIEEADSASKAKGEFLAGMSHEIRTPMNAIIGMAELISDTTLNEEQKEYLEIMKVSSNNLLGIINDILDISKIEAGELELEKKEFNLPELVETTGISLAVRANEKRLELLCHITPDIPEYIISDSVRLRQILVNLTGNAIKFTEKGEIVISLRIEERKNNEALIHFWVSDTGVGIPQERQDKIFDSFTQADGSTTRKYGGTGLGLTISKQLAEKMGGRIWVESEHGKGSVFHFTIRAAIVEKTRKKEKIIFPDLKNLKVLIIDDNFTNRLILQDAASTWGLLPSEAPDGQSGLKELESAKQKSDPYQLILLDKNMPDLDGFEVTQKIKQIPGCADIPIIFVTSSEEKGDRQKAKDLGISDYLLKPVRRSKLYDAIINALAAEGKKKEKPEKQKIESLLKNRSLKILLAEDNLINQKMALRLLEKQGWQVTVANNGKEAVELIGKNGFDLVLMDVQMPEMDGIEATAEIRNMEKTSGKHIPIIALTANAFEEDKRKCLESGMDAYTTKPIKIQELFGIIEDMV